ncbi:MAG: HPF/RaiA family ribosome-associated protein [Myxococcota bacterium]|jgi:ribosome-associated translation inhibitor RaiA|nr:HPF/RaiA family ribosome-associated protein [Myxococcota bacterium]
MQVQVTGLSTPANSTIRERIEQQVVGSLQRLRHHIRGVRIKLDIGGGHEPSYEKHCQIELSLYPTGLIVIEGKGSDAYTAINDGLADAKRSIKRHFDRMREPRRTAAQAASA